jgi:hypothetical protein
VSAAPNYAAAVLRLLATVPPGTGLDVSVLHDSWCAQLAGTGPCDCAPELLVRRPAGAADPRDT